jgi:hypothetical protein
MGKKMITVGTPGPGVRQPEGFPPMNHFDEFRKQKNNENEKK